MSGGATLRHGIVRSRVGTAALLLLATAAWGSQRPTASSAAAPGNASPPAAATVAAESSDLHLASLRLIGELRSPLWLDLYVSRNVIAATVQGRLRSAFPVKLTNGQLVPVAPAPSRVLVIASSTDLTNPFVYADSAANPDPLLVKLQQPYSSNITATIVSLKNTLDWMLAAEDFVELSATIVPPSP